MTTLKDIKQFNLKTFIEPDGKLTPIELDRDLLFEVKRIFYVYGVHDQEDRGEHSHHTTEQVLICLNGQVKVLCDDGKDRKEWILDKPNEALYIPNLIWDEQVYYDKNTVLLVLSDTLYDPEDYIDDYEEFRSLKNGNN